jgi:hypothetical protein
VFIIFNGKALEAGLVQMAFSRSVVMRVITLSVSSRYPAKQLTHPAVPRWPQDQVPMIGHQDVGVKLDRVLLQSLSKDAQERLVVLVFVKDRLPSITTIQGMVNPSGFINSLLPRHGRHSPLRLAGTLTISAY